MPLWLLLSPPDDEVAAPVSWPPWPLWPARSPPEEPAPVEAGAVAAALLAAPAPRASPDGVLALKRSSRVTVERVLATAVLSPRFCRRSICTDTGACCRAWVDTTGLACACAPAGAWAPGLAPPAPWWAVAPVAALALVAFARLAAAAWSGVAVSTAMPPVDPARAASVALSGASAWVRSCMPAGKGSPWPVVRAPSAPIGPDRPPARPWPLPARPPLASRPVSVSASVAAPRLALPWGSPIHCITAARWLPSAAVAFGSMLVPRASVADGVALPSALPRSAGRPVASLALSSDSSMEKWSVPVPWAPGLRAAAWAARAPAAWPAPVVLACEEAGAVLIGRSSVLRTAGLSALGTARRRS
ncbi:hypothetical protein [Hydrogenophaga sp. MI9]|uniref:hypothetical protein n=1 Tax=Hydrogenophaga sp. MI9 TaxID=3453719 RepID=UPI003EEC4B8A